MLLTPRYSNKLEWPSIELRMEYTIYGHHNIYYCLYE